MVVVPLAASENNTACPTGTARKIDTCFWVRVAAAGSLAAGGVLLMSGKRRAGLAAAAAGTALTVVDQKETVRELWNRLPGYLGEVQNCLTRVQSAVDELSAQSQRLHSIWTK